MGNYPFKGLVKLRNHSAILVDGYNHKKLFTLKLKGKVYEDISTASKATASLKGDKLVYGGEAKFNFPCGQCNLETRVKNDGSIKLHLDGGTLEALDKNFNVFTNVKTNTSGSMFKIAVGSVYTGDKCVAANRLEYGNDIIFTERINLKYQKFNLGLTGGFNFTKMLPRAYNAALNFCEDKFHFHLEHQSLKAQKEFGLGRILGTVVYKHANDLSLAAQVRHKFEKNKTRIVVGANGTLSNHISFKAKFDNFFKLTNSIKYKLNKHVSAGLTSQFRIPELLEGKENKSPLPFPLGFSLEFSL